MRAAGTSPQTVARFHGVSLKTVYRYGASSTARRPRRPQPAVEPFRSTLTPLERQALRIRHSAILSLLQNQLFDGSPEEALLAVVAPSPALLAASIERARGEMAEAA